MTFCPNCNNILDISKSSFKKSYNIDETPSEQTDENEDKIHDIINKLLKDEPVNDIDNIRLEQILNHETYTKLDKQKKSDVHAKLNVKFGRQDDSNAAYYVCRTCSYSKKIDTGEKVASKIGTSTQTNYLNIDRFKTKIYNRALRYTRRYDCPNKDCPGNKDPVKHEAVICRNGDTMQVFYICKCGAIIS